MAEPQRVSASAVRAAVSWTGGKDCNLALLHAWRDASLHVTALCLFRPPGQCTFRAHPLKIIEAQAHALGLPLLQVEVGPDDSGGYQASYVSGLRGLKAQHGIQAIVTGDMDLVGSMPRNWINECADIAGLDTRLPLWQADRRECLDRLLAEGFSLVFSCVKSPWFDERWVGRALDAEAVAALADIAAGSKPLPAGAKPLDLGGERGEYHTMTLDGPLYRRPLRLSDVSAHEIKGDEGQPDTQSWWAMQCALLAE